MRGLPSVLALLALPFRALGTAYDERNIRRLAERYGCSLAEASELYRHSRRDGFGSAHEAVFGPGTVVTADVTTDEDDLTDTRLA